MRSLERRTARLEDTAGYRDQTVIVVMPGESVDEVKERYIEGSRTAPTDWIVVNIVE